MKRTLLDFFVSGVLFYGGVFVLGLLFSAGLLALETWLIMIILNWLIGLFGGVASVTLLQSFGICCILNLVKIFFSK